MATSSKLPKFLFFVYFFDASINFSFIVFSIVILGNKSDTSASNNKISLAKNFGIFESFMAFIKTSSSDDFKFDLLSYPAITNNDFTALKPKS